MAGRPGSPNTVQFDVGGQLFKTSRSLIDQHEGTMLACLVSEIWQDDPTKSVFIDRDGDIFAQVLNYLRYGSIFLPSKIPKSMFLRDLDFYGIVPAEGTVKTESEGWAVRMNSVLHFIGTPRFGSIRVLRRGSNLCVAINPRPGRSDSKEENMMYFHPENSDGAAAYIVGNMGKIGGWESIKAGMYRLVEKKNPVHGSKGGCTILASWNLSDDPSELGSCPFLDNQIGCVKSMLLSLEASSSSA